MTTPELLEHSDLLDCQLRLRQAAFREGYERGYETGYAAGRKDEASERDHAWNEIARPVSRTDPELLRKRWAVRGELRTREAFGQPHPGDYQGRGGAA